jgi:hypothetical protein
MNIPGQLAAGDSITWHDDAAKDNLGNAVTSTDWALTYYIRGAQSLDINATANGPGWSTTISAAQSGTLTAGTFYWQAVVTKGSDRITLGSGQIKITPNLSAATAGYDGRSEAEQALSAINTEIQARLTGGLTEEYTIGNRSLKKTSMKDLLEMQARYKSIVARERQASQIAQGLGNPRALYVRF